MIEPVDAQQTLEDVLHTLVTEHGLTAYDIAGDPGREQPIVIDRSKDIEALRGLIERLEADK